MNCEVKKVFYGFFFVVLWFVVLVFGFLAGFCFVMILMFVIVVQASPYST